MVYRIYVEKRPGLRSEAEAVYHDMKSSLPLENLKGLRLLQRYDVEGLDEEDFQRAVRLLLSEPPLDESCQELPDWGTERILVEYLPGQYDQRADSAEQCLQILLGGERPRVRSAKVYLLDGELTEEELSCIRRCLINPVEAREASEELPETLRRRLSPPEDVRVLSGFSEAGEERLRELRQELSLAMDLEDLRFCREYFRTEGRDPSLTELRMIDTYWSDHCRHTTFLTMIEGVELGDPQLKRAWERYLHAREELKRDAPASLMDLATIAARLLRKEGKLEGLSESEEINACTVRTKIKTEEGEEDYYLLFKNETHNHPTEIEPFGGAATCIGGAIRDPLSGRGYVYQAMRLSGAADPSRPIQDSLPGKLPQRKIVIAAARGFSSYGNQVGIATGIVEELYHPGYAAKRMEIGAVLAAVPVKNVRRERPLPGDLVLLLGGRTGRDGIGGATGSSKAHSSNSLSDCGAEVQKGNAPEERKLQRFFRNPAASRLIKRCNDFGAGGISVAVGELADGLDIDLDRVPRKYEGLDGTELAISESQERMAVVIAPEDEAEIFSLAERENLEVARVARVTEKRRLRMYWRGNCILDLSRDFLSSNGAKKRISIESGRGESISRKVEGSFRERLLSLSEDLNSCSHQGLSEEFDSTIGGGTILLPFGGKYQRTPIQAMAARIPVRRGKSDTVSLMAFGGNPYVTEKNPYRGGYLAVVESVSKLIAAGAEFSEIYLSLQEYFGKPGEVKSRWGAPLGALLGAFSAQLDLGVAAIGGKDSMSGSFEKLDVPPTLISFAVTTGEAGEILSPEYKEAGHRVLWLRPEYREELPETKSLLRIFSLLQSWRREGRLASLYTPGFGGISEAVMKQCMGNGFGFRFAESLSLEDLFGYQYASFLLELREEADLPLLYREAQALEGVVLADLGTVLPEREYRYQSESVSADELLSLYEGRLEEIFPLRTVPGEKTDLGEREKKDPGLPDHREELWGAPAVPVSRPRVLIPVFPGTNCEYDSERACLTAGLDPEILVIRNLTGDAIAESLREASERLREAQILFLPGGFSGGDEPEGSAKLITSFFRNERMRESTMELLKKRDGLILGICNGFQALIKLGLLPYGEIRDSDVHSPTLSFNTIGRHQSKIVRTRLCSNLSPWLMNAEVGSVYEVAVSHGEGRFLCEEELLHRLSENGQIATQYADFEGRASMALFDNPNGSDYAVEGICSPDGRIFGKMGHVERWQPGNFKNAAGNYDMALFRSAKEYFEL